MAEEEARVPKMRLCTAFAVPMSETNECVNKTKGMIDMKMMFEDKIVSWMDSFDIFDEIGRKLFRVEAKEDGRRLKVYDPSQHNKSVATLKESLDVSSPSVEIKHSTRYVSAVKQACMKFKKLFDLGFLNWCAVGDFDHGNYRILDGNDRTIASVGETFYNHESMRVIDTLPEYLLHSLTFTLAIDVQLSESETDAPATVDP